MLRSKQTEFGRRLEALVVRVTSPDGHILASVKGRGSPIVAFESPDSIDRYRSSDEVARQISRSLERVIESRSDGRKYVIESYSRLEVRTEAGSDTDVRVFESKCADLVGYGVSPSEQIDVATVGLREWEVDIDADYFLGVESTELCTELNAAIRQANSSFAARVRELRNEIYG